MWLLMIANATIVRDRITIQPFSHTLPFLQSIYLVIHLLIIIIIINRRCGYVKGERYNVSFRK